MKNNYGHTFYQDRHKNTLHSAQAVLTIILEALPEINSAIDFGCGVGTWLSVLQTKGVDEILGIDGPWVEKDLLEIPEEDFRQVNFEKPIALDKKYDLAITLEVAEHLSSQAAVPFVESLIASSNFVLFSAAIPSQGGKGHLNEQWQEYWANLFDERGYVALDFVRKQVWNDEQIPTWYRQNILLYAKKDLAHTIKIPSSDEYQPPSGISLVHPTTYLHKVNQIKQMSTVRGSLGVLQKALLHWGRKKLGKN